MLGAASMPPAAMLPKPRRPSTRATSMKMAQPYQGRDCGSDALVIVVFLR